MIDEPESTRLSAHFPEGRYFPKNGRIFFEPDKMLDGPDRHAPALLTTRPEPYLPWLSPSLDFRYFKGGWPVAALKQVAK